jgi:hypothetical protein
MRSVIDALDLGRLTGSAEDVVRGRMPRMDFRRYWIVHRCSSRVVWTCAKETGHYVYQAVVAALHLWMAVPSSGNPVHSYVD